MEIIELHKRYCPVCGQPEDQEWLYSDDEPMVGWWSCKNRCETVAKDSSDFLQAKGSNSNKVKTIGRGV